MIVERDGAIETEELMLQRTNRAWKRVSSAQVAAHNTYDNGLAPGGAESVRAEQIGTRFQMAAASADGKMTK